MSVETGRELPLEGNERQGVRQPERKALRQGVRQGVRQPERKALRQGVRQSELRGSGVCGLRAEYEEGVFVSEVTDMQDRTLSPEAVTPRVAGCNPGEDGEEMDPKEVLLRLSRDPPGSTAEEEFCHSRAGEASNQPSTGEALDPPGILTFDPSVTRSDCGGYDIPSVVVSIVQGGGPADSPVSEKEPENLGSSGTVWEEEPDPVCPDVQHFHPLQDLSVLAAAEVMVDHQGDADSSMIQRETEAVFPESCSPLTHTQIHSSPDNRETEAVFTDCQGTGTSSTLHRASGSDSESFLSTGEDSVFGKGDDTVTGDSTSELSVSRSSAEDTASGDPTSSSPESCLRRRGQGRRGQGRRGQGSSWSAEEGHKPGARVGGGGETEEEAQDRPTEVPRLVPGSSAEPSPSVRSLSPFRRHSWGPGKNLGGEEDMNQRSAKQSPGEVKTTFHRSYSLEGLREVRDDGKIPSPPGATTKEARQHGAFRHQGSEERGGSLVSLTEEQDAEMEVRTVEHGQKSRRCRPLRNSCPPMNLPLTKSVSLLAINQRDMDTMARIRHRRRISFSFSLSPILPKSKSTISLESSSSDDEPSLRMRTFSSTSGSLAYSISEEDSAGNLRAGLDGKSGTKVSRTFSYLKNKMYKKTREKDREKSRDKEERKEAKDRERRTLNGHHFSTVSSQTQSSSCHQCSKPINTKEAFLCTNCNAHVHKGCRESLPVCAKVKLKVAKQQFVPDTAVIPVVTLRTKRESKPAVSRERPWSAILLPEDPSLLMLPQRRHTSIMPFHGSNLSKSISISNIAGHQVFDDTPIKGLRYLSQSTDSLCKTSLGCASTESLIDEGAEMVDGQLMGEFEANVKELEADSWSNIMDNNFLKHLKKEVVKRQDVIYELIQTEMHHVRTIRIMEVYSKGLQKDLQLEPQALGRLFPALDDLLDLHTSLLARLLERKRESQQEREDGGFVINKIGDILQTQFSGSRAELMKRVYGKFCSRHNEAVNFYKELHSRDKRFQAFIRKKMTSSIVRRLSIPECILLVTQRITKYPVLMQRILQHTTETEEDHQVLSDALWQLKEVIAAVDSKVNEQERKRRQKDIYSRTDSKSIMRMKSGQMFAKEDLLRWRRLVHDGPLQLKNAQGRLKDVTAMLLSDVLVFLQEKDQKYVFASLDQRSTVLSLQKLIVREVANEERGLFLITAGIEKPEMLEVHAATKEERNTWMQLIQDTMQSIEKEEDEEVPSEPEERPLEAKAKEMREMLRRKDEQILSLLVEKMTVFREMCEFGSPSSPLEAGPERDPGPSPTQGARRKLLFRVGSGGSSEDVPKGEPIMKDALLEVETLQALVNGGLDGAEGGLQMGHVTEGARGGGIGPGPVCLPRRAETFGGFDLHQIHAYKNGAKVEPEDPADLRRTESDGVLKKGGNANLLLLRKRSSQVLQSVTNIHDLLSSLQAVVIQQDSLIEDQRQALTLRPERFSSSSSRPNTLIEQEKQRSLEKHRQEMATLQRQLATHDQEKRRREREWEERDRQLTDREVQVLVQEEEMGKMRRKLDAERQELQGKKEDYQKDLERLRDAQRKLDRDRELVHRELERIETMRVTDRQIQNSSSTSDDSLHPPDSASQDRQPGDPTDLPSFPRRDSLTQATEKNLSPPPLKAPRGDHQNQIPSRLLQLARDRGKDKKDKKHKVKKGQEGALSPETKHLEAQMEGEVYYC
ncbi:A-kinase anchor protein 13 isoform X4 [Esox lucius]|uniref:A-kinase anchor protein 13 isoform X4 n=1 Tax=Esox lucius TaxID=8010 RepID=UPI0014773E64|nr:A-kinase anchor protein 13 isoform X4 [Esox lucius]